jgi:antitoxin component YwqK of YwqJK toxin-antitoxin module
MKKSTAAPPENGRHEEHFADGSVSVAGEYADGKKTGEWKYHLRNGRLKAVGRGTKTAG